MENNSGTKSPEVPEEIKGWSWGAFLLTWIWGIFNSVFISLLMFIPLVNVVIWILLGIKGNEWAWQNKRWESIEQFKRVQKKWAIAGVIVFIAGLVLGVLQVIVLSSMS